MLPSLRMTLTTQRFLDQIPLETTYFAVVNISIANIVKLVQFARNSINTMSTSPTSVITVCVYDQSLFITARKQSLRRFCFHRCLSVHGGVCLPSRDRETHTPWDQRRTPPFPRTRHTPPKDRPPTMGRHPPGRHPPGQTPPGSACWDTVNSKRMVRITLEYILVE